MNCSSKYLAETGQTRSAVFHENHADELKRTSFLFKLSTVTTHYGCGISKTTSGIKLTRGLAWLFVEGDVVHDNIAGRTLPRCLYKPLQHQLQ